MSSVLNTSTMKSPPLDDCVAGSLTGACVSTAICRGPGPGAFNFFAAGTVASAGATVIAAVPASAAPFKKLRRPIARESCDFDTATSQDFKIDFGEGCRHDLRPSRRVSVGPPVHCLNG